MSLSEERIPHTYTLSAMPFYDTCSSQYYTVLTIDRMPEGHLARHVRRLVRPGGVGANRVLGGCCLLGIEAFLPRCSGDAALGGSAWERATACGAGCHFLTPNDLPGLYSYLRANGYTIDTQLTNMMHFGTVRSRPGDLVCFIGWLGTPPAN